METKRGLRRARTEILVQYTSILSIAVQMLSRETSKAFPDPDEVARLQREVDKAKADVDELNRTL